MTPDGGERRLLVTGAFGYLGGRICRVVAERADLSLVGTSRRADAARPSWPLGPLLTWDAGGDAADLLSAAGPVDTICHLVGADQRASAADPRAALDITAGATCALLDAAIAAGTRRFIYISTAHVYGAPLAGVIDETRSARPATPYAITHRAAEDFVLAAHGQRRIEGVVLRLSNAVGAPDRRDTDCWQLVANDLCRQAVAGGDLVLTSSGEQWRDFIALSDIVAAVLHFSDLPADRLGDGLFNLGGGRPMRILDMAELVAQRCGDILGRRPRVVRHGETPCPSLDYRIDRILATGFRPGGDIEGEIDALLARCRQGW